MSVEMTNIKVWAESSANTLLMEASQGILDNQTGFLTIPHPVFKAIKQKSVDDRTIVSGYLPVWVDATQKAGAAAAAPAGAKPTPPLQFSRRKFKMNSMVLKELTGRGVKLERA